MKKEIIATTKAPGAIGPYSQAVKVGNMVFTSGQLPINPETGEHYTDCIKKATRQCLENAIAILEEAGSSLENIVKTTIFIKDLNNFNDVNEVYSEFFKENAPARSCIEAARLPKDTIIEIEAIAIV
ncbi:MAG: RidA family protein [Defluviitaleaceae bacterium]|nr:RidA family protein [Defluviitaleaceae bacterium]